MADEPIEIVEYDPIWSSRYDRAAAELHTALASWVVEIEHIGSTAVAGLAAKPVIDIQVGVTSLDASTEIVRALEPLGYRYVPEFEAIFPRRRYFRRVAPDGRRTHQLHLVERSDSDWWDRHLAFRDWLRTHADDRERYAALKRRLAIEFRNDRAGYTDAKTSLIEAIVDLARAG